MSQSTGDTEQGERILSLVVCLLGNRERIFLSSPVPANCDVCFMTAVVFCTVARSFPLPLS